MSILPSFRNIFWRVNNNNNNKATKTISTLPFGGNISWPTTTVTTVVVVHKITTSTTKKTFTNLLYYDIEILFEHWATTAYTAATATTAARLNTTTTTVSIFKISANFKLPIDLRNIQNYCIW